jgi:hypothetical protein
MEWRSGEDSEGMESMASPPSPPSCRHPQGGGEGRRQEEQGGRGTQGRHEHAQLCLRFIPSSSLGTIPARGHMHGSAAPPSWWLANGNGRKGLSRAATAGIQFDPPGERGICAHAALQRRCDHIVELRLSHTVIPGSASGVLVEVDG